LGDPIVFSHTNSSENIFIGGDDIPSERNFKNAPWRRNSTSGLKLGAFTRSGTYVCVIMHNFSKIRQSSDRVMATQIIQDGRRPPFWIMEESVFGLFCSLQDPIIYVHTKFGENIDWRRRYTNIHWWQFGVAVARWSRSTWLSYIGPG